MHRQTFHGISPLRGVVCMCIVIFHYYYTSVAIGDAFWPMGLFFFNFRPGVESFFLLSGFLMAHTLRPVEGVLSVRRLLLRRFFRLAVPFWLVLIAIHTLRLVHAALIGPFVAALPSLQAVIAEVLFASYIFGFNRVDHAHWSLASLLQAYIIIALTFWLVRGIMIKCKVENYWQKTLTLMIAIFLLMLCISSISKVFGLFDYDANKGFQLPKWCAFIAVGYLVYAAVAGWMSAWIVWAAACVLGVTGACTSDDRWLWGCGMTAVLYYLGRRNPSVANRRPLSWFSAVGQWSYGIYLVHSTVFVYSVLLLTVVARRLPLHTSNEIIYASAMLIALVLSVVLGRLIYYRVERPLEMGTRRLHPRGATWNGGGKGASTANPPAASDLAPAGSGGDRVATGHS